MMIAATGLIKNYDIVSLRLSFFPITLREHRSYPVFGGIF
ncbi:MAG: hypothetical protein H6P94_570 [Thermoplasmatales archaeon]|nr:hypothetical protein [Thermoplasmatales archaeon]